MASNTSEPPHTTEQAEKYRRAVQQFGPDIARFVAGYERDPAIRQELLQEVHVALWQSMAVFREQSSLRTWVYRVAHNVGVTHIRRARRRADHGAMALEDLPEHADENAAMSLVERQIDLRTILALVHQLQPVDRQVVMLYLEGLDAAAIGEVTGLSARNVATKIHRIKAGLASRLRFPKEKS